MFSQPPLVSLVLQSKKALQHGEALCSRANHLSNASAQCAIDLLELDAKVRWIVDAVGEQLKLAANVAKVIEMKRAQLDERVERWESQRTHHSDALDTILEALGTQVVPPEFHQSTSDFAQSIFGSQHSDSDENENELEHNGPMRSPTLTIRDGHGRTTDGDRKKWKTLRDFVDERAIENVLERIERDRADLDTILNQTDAFPENLTSTITTIRASLPSTDASADAMRALESQAEVSTHMAELLESLASHYDAMAAALRESESGEGGFGEEDLHDMNRDTEELPSIMAELEENVFSIQSSHEQLLSSKSNILASLSTLPSTLSDLDELGSIMGEMLLRQESTTSSAQDHLATMEAYITVLEDLCTHYMEYRSSFDRLLIEIARRVQYREAAEKIVEGMGRQLDAMVDEERLLREDFNSTHGAHLPADICLCIENPPTKWEVMPWGGSIEVLPDVAIDLLGEAKDRVGRDHIPGSDSL